MSLDSLKLEFSPAYRRPASQAPASHTRGRIRNLTEQHKSRPRADPYGSGRQHEIHRTLPPGRIDAAGPVVVPGPG